MKVNVYGLTAATISFNTVGMMLRGKYSTKPEEYNPCSVAYNLILDNEHQANEIMAVANLGLIRVEVLEEPETQEKKVEDIINQTQQATQAPKESPAVKENPRRTPKKLKEQKNESKVAEIPPPEELTPASDLRVPTAEELEEESRVIVMTDTGPAGGKMVHKMNGEIDENDPRCKAAMEAARELKEEEGRDDDLIDDSLLDPSQRMGSKAVIGTGSGDPATVEMKNSAVGQRAEPNFIDLGLDDEDDEVEKAFIDDEVNDEGSAFIDLGEEEEDDLGDAFIEI